MSERQIDFPKTEKSLARLNRIAHLMDDQFELPIIKYRVGLDPIIGLIPGGGDWVTWVVSVFILWEAVKLGVPKRTLMKMGYNLTLDLVAGYVPILGDMADAVIKANRRNVDLVFLHFGAHIDPLAQSHVIITQNPSEREPVNIFLLYVLGVFMIAFLFLVASVPFVLLYWALN